MECALYAFWFAIGQWTGGKRFWWWSYQDTTYVLRTSSLSQRSKCMCSFRIHGVTSGAYRGLRWVFLCKFTQAVSCSWCRSFEEFVQSLSVAAWNRSVSPSIPIGLWRSNLLVQCELFKKGTTPSNSSLNMKTLGCKSAKLRADTPLNPEMVKVWMSPGKGGREV